LDIFLNPSVLNLVSRRCCCSCCARSRRDVSHELYINEVRFPFPFFPSFSFLLKSHSIFKYRFLHRSAISRSRLLNHPTFLIHSLTKNKFNPSQHAILHLSVLSLGPHPHLTSYLLRPILLQHRHQYVQYLLPHSSSCSPLPTDLPLPFLNKILTYYTDTRIFNAALTDNGGQKCSVTNALVADGDVLLVLPCDDGYSATFDFDNGDVAYSTPWFNGDFGTDEEFSQANIFDDVYTYWTANVWGC